VRDLSRLPRGNLLDLPPGAARIAASPTGDAAAFYYGDSRTVKVITGLPGSPVVSWTAELPELAGGLAALAISDGGRGVLAAGTEQGLVLLAAPDLGARTLWAVAGSPSVAFFVNSLDFVVADGALNRVVVVRDPKGDAQVLQIADASQGVSGPVAVTTASDGRRVFVANAEPPGVLALSLAGEDPITLSCACRPTGLDRLAGDGVFRLNEARQGPLWLLDDTGASPRIVFVPYEPSQPSPRVLPVRVRETGDGSAPRVRATR